MNKITVIIPCYNSYTFMDKCIKSLEQQTFKDFNVIFIDDCSTDRTYDLLKIHLKKTDLKFKLVKNEKNRGPGASRNNGIELSDGEYITFMDSDDWYEKDRLELMYKKAKNENLDVVMCDYFRTYDNGKRKSIHPTRIFENNITKENVLANSFDSLCCMLIKRKIFDGIKIPELFNGEDVAIIPVIILRSQRIGIINKELYNYFYRKNSLSNRRNESKKIAQSLCETYKYIYDNVFDKFPIETEFIGIKVVLYGAILNALQGGCTNSDLENIINKFEDMHPNWSKNKYISNIGISKKSFIRCVNSRSYIKIRVLNYIRDILFATKIA